MLKFGAVSVRYFDILIAVQEFKVSLCKDINVLHRPTKFSVLLVNLSFERQLVQKQLQYLSRFPPRRGAQSEEEVIREVPLQQHSTTSATTTATYTCHRTNAQKKRVQRWCQGRPHGWR